MNILTVFATDLWHHKLNNTFIGNADNIDNAIELIKLYCVKYDLESLHDSELKEIILSKQTNSRSTNFIIEESELNKLYV